MAQTKVIRCSKKEFEREVENKWMEGYEIKSKTENIAILETKEIVGGSILGHTCLHLIVLVLTFWTFGLGNLLFGIYCFHRGQKILRIEVED